MIENERQYEVTKQRVANFEGALARADQENARFSVDMQRLMKFEFQRELDNLRANIAAYESRQQERRSA